MRVLPFALRAAQTSRSPVTARTEFPSEKLNLLTAASVITARGEPLLLPPSPPPGPRRSPNAQTIRRVPDIGQKPSPRPNFRGRWPGSLAGIAIQNNSGLPNDLRPALRQGEPMGTPFGGDAWRRGSPGCRI